MTHPSNLAETATDTLSRPATVADLDALVEIEQHAFIHDRFSRRNLRYLLLRAHAATWVLVDETDRPFAYVMVLFHAGTSLARLYSYAVLPARRGEGYGHQLLNLAEQVARAQDCVEMRLEVHEANAASLALVRRHGYRQFEVRPGYYEDSGTALRFEKRLVTAPEGVTIAVPYYRQTLDFTCGPAALMMAMHALRPDMHLTRTLELRLWREATSIFMTAGHGGCDPYGLALAALRRGFKVSVYASEPGRMFTGTVRDTEKKVVMELVQEDFLAQLRDAGAHLLDAPLTPDVLPALLARGALPVVLISSYRIYHEKSPHWVVVTGVDERLIHVHDPYVDETYQRSATDSVNLPIRKDDFVRMARYGRSAQRGFVLLER